MASKSNGKKSSASRAVQKKQNEKKQMQNRREMIGLMCFALAILGMICYFNTDAFLIAPLTKLIGGLFGQIGRYILPLALVYTGLILFKSKGKPVVLRILSTVTITFTVSAIMHLIVEVFDGEIPSKVSELYARGMHWGSGGVVPGGLAELLEKAITRGGAFIALILLFAWQLLGCMRISINGLITAIKNRPREEVEEVEEIEPAERVVTHFTNSRQQRRERKRQAAELRLSDDEDFEPEEPRERPKRRKVPSPVDVLEKQRAEEEMPVIDATAQQVTIDEIELQEPEILQPPKPEQHTPPAPKPEAEKLKKGDAQASAAEISEEIEKKTEEAVPQAYMYPPIALLNLRRKGAVDGTGEMRETSKRLSETLESFGIVPHIVDVIRGPSVTRYEIELERGVKLSRITNLSEDIALSLGVASVRVAAIPDKISTVGIEVPNKVVNMVGLREVIDSQAFRGGKSKLSFAVGKDISGACIVGDIAGLPHLLIAGTTGSGKSVCMNSLIVSLLYKAKPDEVKLIMIDPKMVELGVYNGIPHLLIPVVTDPKKAAGSLQWAVTEMLRRYRMMSEAKVRDLESYNKFARKEPELEPLPQIVVVIDELADLMLVAAKEVEESIIRIAQMGRASGIHLVVATQRPSADVITGVMKSNIPSRIAFSVASAMESRIILDSPGAEKLVGKGDMLFAPTGAAGKRKRVQGCFISESEVQAVVDEIKAQTTSDYSDEIINQIEKSAAQSGKSKGADADHGSESEHDELLPSAVEVVLEIGQASVSMLQRRLKLGYARAARIVDEMEELGVVGPFEGAKPRQVLITREQWQQMQGGSYDFTPPVEEEIP